MCLCLSKLLLVYSLGRLDAGAFRVGGTVIDSTRITRITIIGMDDPNIQCLDHGTYNLLCVYIIYIHIIARNSVNGQLLVADTLQTNYCYIFTNYSKKMQAIWEVSGWWCAASSIHFLAFAQDVALRSMALLGILGLSTRPMAHGHPWTTCLRVIRHFSRFVHHMLVAVFPLPAQERYCEKGEQRLPIFEGPPVCSVPFLSRGLIWCPPAVQQD